MPSSFPNFISNLNSLIAMPSVSSANSAIDSSNEAVVTYLADQFEAMGFACELIASPSASGLKKLNLLATMGTGPGGLVLSGHTDTVPLDEELWHVNPFQATEKDGRLYGLGCTDMKGFFPVVIEAVRQLTEAKFKHPLIVLATADEETSMEGAKTLVKLGKPQARYAVIGEPTGLKPVFAHKGIMMESIRLLGQSGHSSDPSLGNNALDAMHLVIGELMLYRQELTNKYQSPIFEIPHPTLNLGCIHGGDNPNRICGQCELEYDVRLLPGMHIEALRAEIAARVHTVTDQLGIKAELNPLFSGVPAFSASDDSELLKSARRLTGHDGISVAFGTEGPHLQALGMDTIILGPGNIDQAHQPDEYMSIEMIDPAIKLINQLITEFCLQ